MKETWKPVVGYEGLYEVSNNGKVKSLNYMKSGKVKELKPDLNKWGYYLVKLSNKGYKGHYIHRLVAEAFIPNPDSLPCVNHKNEVKTNNWVTNLEWCTHKYNNNYGTGIRKRALALSKPILQFSITGEFIQEWESASYAARCNGWNHTNINNCCLGKYKTAYNYIWKFKEL